MRGVKVFSGRSHPALSEAICERLGTSLGQCELGNFANGETSVQIGSSVRNDNVFIVQSGSRKTNDSVMEMLIMIAACKGGSAKSITAVMPYFPYSRSSKKKSHRGPITAKMLANLMQVAGVDHVITVDLHASQMQGFFRQGVDNLYSEPLISRWIKSNVPHWQNAVVVSKNVGGSKRVTSLADALKLSFAIVSTDRARTSYIPQSMMDSTTFFDAIEPQAVRAHRAADTNKSSSPDPEPDPAPEPEPELEQDQDQDQDRGSDSGSVSPSEIEVTKDVPRKSPNIRRNGRLARPKAVKIASSPLIYTTRAESNSPPSSPNRLERVGTTPSARRPSEYEAAEGFHDERARDVVIGRLIQGHIVDDDHPSPALSGMSSSLYGLPGVDLNDHAYDPMASSIMSTASSFQHPDHALGGSCDAEQSSDEEEARIQSAEIEHTVTLVGNVRDRTVLLMDDLMDRSGSWIAAAETCVKRGGANKVYCIGIHGLFGGDSLEEMEACECINHIVVTNTFPISPERYQRSRKLIVIDLSNLLSEAIRRNHHGGNADTHSLL